MVLTGLTTLELIPIPDDDPMPALPIAVVRALAVSPQLATVRELVLDGMRLGAALAPPLDQAFAALLEDLRQRGFAPAGTPPGGGLLLSRHGRGIARPVDKRCYGS